MEETTSMTLKAFLFLGLIALVQARNVCEPKTFDTGTVCVCNETYCDTVDPLTKTSSGEYVIYTSNMEGLRFERSTDSFDDTSLFSSFFTVDHSKKFQEIQGFGGAFTDATGINIDSLGPNAQKHLMNSYFSKDGIEYSVARIPIGGTDFGTRAYTYLDTAEPDLDLSEFALAEEDFKYKIPFIKQAIDLTGGVINFFASAWTAPKWMKTNEEYAGSGGLKPEFYQLWVDYFIRFFDEYKKEGIDFWGLTTGNEPSLAFFTFTGINTVGWLPWTQNRWIRNNLGPTIRNHPEYKDLKLMAHDDQRILLPLLFRLFDDQDVIKYIDGIGVHWYWDDFVPASWLTQTHNRYPDKFILATEACKGDRPWDAAVELGSWKRGQAYAVDIIGDLQNWATGWIDWNMALDTTGGPTYIDNNVDSPIIVNADDGEFYKQPMFYAMGHFSKFLPKGSVRILTPDSFNGLSIVALERPDNDGTVVVIVNTEEEERDISLYDPNVGRYINRKITAKSFNTIVYW